MIISATSSTPPPTIAAATPGGPPPAAGTLLATVAPESFHGAEVRLAEELPGRFTAVDDAVRAADRIMQSHRKAATTTLFPFRRKVELLDPIAVIANGSVFELYRTRGATVDPWDRKEGYIFKQWRHVPGRTDANRVDASLQALVGWSRVARFDRDGDAARLR